MLRLCGFCVAELCVLCAEVAARRRASGGGLTRKGGDLGARGLGAAGHVVGWHGVTSSLCA